MAYFENHFNSKNTNRTQKLFSKNFSQKDNKWKELHKNITFSHLVFIRESYSSAKTSMGSNMLSIIYIPDREKLSMQQFATIKSRGRARFAFVGLAIPLLNSSNISLAFLHNYNWIVFQRHKICPTAMQEFILVWLL